jgi:hypothetical protein
MTPAERLNTAADLPPEPLTDLDEWLDVLTAELDRAANRARRAYPGLPDDHDRTASAIVARQMAPLLAALRQRPDVLSLPPEPPVGTTVELVASGERFACASRIGLWRNLMNPADSDIPYGREWHELLNLAGPAGVRVLPADDVEVLPYPPDAASGTGWQLRCNRCQTYSGVFSERADAVSSAAAHQCVPTREERSR